MSTQKQYNSVMSPSHHLEEHHHLGSSLPFTKVKHGSDQTSIFNFKLMEKKQNTEEHTVTQYSDKIRQIQTVGNSTRKLHNVFHK